MVQSVVTHREPGRRTQRVPSMEGRQAALPAEYGQQVGRGCLPAIVRHAPDGALPSRLPVTQTTHGLNHAEFSAFGGSAYGGQSGGRAGSPSAPLFRMTAAVSAKPPYL